MRILTIGVLIVTCGTLASLPFRRQHPSGDGDAPQASGPDRSALVSERWPFHAPEPFHALEAFHAPEPFHAPEARSSQDHRLTPRSISLAPPPPSTIATDSTSPPAVGRQFRDARPPATYEDLLIPIDQSRVLRDRFSATFERDNNRSHFVREPVSKSEGGLEPELETREPSSSARLVPPDGSPSVTSQASLRRLSSEEAKETPPPLPTLEPDLERDAVPGRHSKHWIRQPQ